MSGTRSSSLSETQEIWLSVIPIVPAIASCLASSALVYVVIRTGFTTPYKRIIFGLSCSDIITSIAFVLQPFLLPTETSQRIWAVGNDATCSLLGTLTQLGMCSLLYNAFLAIYFLLIIRFGVRERSFAKRYEKYLHAFCIVWSSATAFIGAGMGFYNEVELGPGCWVSHYPDGCSHATFECTSPMIAWIFSGIWVMFTLILVVVTNVVIYRHVKRELYRGRMRSANPSVQTLRTRQVAVQASLYILAFWGCFIWTVILRIIESENFDAQDEAKLFPLLVLQAAFVPLTGVFNLLVFLRPRYLQTRAEVPQESRLWALRRALYGETVKENSTPEPVESERTERSRLPAIPGSKRSSRNTTEPDQPSDGILLRDEPDDQDRETKL